MTNLIIVFGFLEGLLLGSVWSKETCPRMSNEPPLDKGLVPWLGHAVEFGKDSATFLLKMKRKHGDIFTVQMAGRFVTVLLDPHSYDSVLWESTAKLDFAAYSRLLMDRIFDVQLPNYDPHKEKNMMKTQLQGENLSTLTQAMSSNLQNVLLSEAKGTTKTWMKEGLFNFCYNILFRAGYLTLFGNEREHSNKETSKNKDRIHSETVYHEYRRLDQLLIKLAYSTLSADEKKEAASVKKRLWSLLSGENLNGKLNRSNWLEGYRNHLQDLELQDDMLARAMVLQIWATQGNIGPATFWLLAFLLKHPEAMTAVLDEINRNGKLHGNKIQFNNPLLTISQDLLDNTPVFDSILNEILRLTAAPYISREILQNMTLRLADSREYNLRKGDRLCLFPYLSPQMDPEIYEEPEKFKYDRFLNADGTEKKNFFKNGKQLKYYNMPWGGGGNVCIARVYAINSIKLFVFMMLSQFDFQLADPEARIPVFDTSRYGFGLMQPEHDIIFQYKPKVE
uniref:Prostacyclin synthase n=1 Tax=Callorhinchus milii TaxID=7868 RepID=A0A4W3IRP0_CALMI